MPPDEYLIATDISNGRMEVRCVQTFTDAILILEEFGGNGVEVAQENGPNILEFSDSPVDEEDGVLSCAEAELAKNE